MAKKNKNIDKLKKLISDKPSSWKEKAEYYKNRPWLREYSSQIARRIIAIINDGDKELSQTKLAQDLGVSRQQVNKIIQGQENLTLESIYNLSKSLKYELIAFPPYKYSAKKNVEMTTNSEIFVLFNVSILMANTLVISKGEGQQLSLKNTTYSLTTHTIN